MADTGKQLKQSVKVFHSLILYLRLPETIKSLLLVLFQTSSEVVLKVGWTRTVHRITIAS